MLYFVTWMDPMKNIQAPWSTRFTSDRNSTLIKFNRMGENKTFTDLIVGSSTSEVFVPQIFKDKYNVDAYLAGDGGASTPVRWIFIKEAVNTHTQLRRVIYVADLFEFKDVKLENSIYFQHQLMKNLINYSSWYEKPEGLDRIYDFLSRKALQNSFKTLKDYIKYKKGTYLSQYRIDGTTEKSMVEYKSSEPIESRAFRLARSYQSIYGNMSELNPKTFEFFELMTSELSQRNIELVVIIPPWHEAFYKVFETHLNETQVYQKWITYLKSLSGPKRRVIDYSYPAYQQKGISESDEFWHDGVHFSKKAMEVMIDEVYSKP